MLNFYSCLQHAPPLVKLRKSEDQLTAARTKMEKPVNKSPRFFLVDLNTKCLGNRVVKIYPDHSPASILADYIRSCGLPLHFHDTDADLALGGIAITVFIDNVEHVTGHGRSKMVAKQQASKRCLKIILPEIKEYWPEEEEHELGFVRKEGIDGIEEPMSLCTKLGESFPYKCLKICLRRNFGQNGLDVRELEATFSFDQDGHHCTLSIQKYTATGSSENRKGAREVAAHKLLMQMHPCISNFGGILQMYGKHSATSICFQRAREERKKVLDLQSMEQKSAPVNFALLAHLREEMLKLKLETTTANERSA